MSLPGNLTLAPTTDIEDKSLSGIASVVQARAPDSSSGVPDDFLMRSAAAAATAVTAVAAMRTISAERSY